jgi:hypothetical protein
MFDYPQSKADGMMSPLRSTHTQIVDGKVELTAGTCNFRDLWPVTMKTAAPTAAVKGACTALFRT